MSDHHGGGHAAHLGAGGDRRALAISAGLTGIYFVIELGIGIWTGSVAVLSDAFHTFSAVGGVLIAMVASRFSERPASAFQTFGYVRAQIVGALLNGLFLGLMALLVLYMGAMRLMEPVDLPTTPMLIAAGGGIATEVISLWLLYQRQKNDLNVKGAFWHILQTFVGSFIIVVSALVIRFTGFLLIDPILGMAFGLVLLWASWRITRDALHILLQGTPRDLELNGVVAAIRSVSGVTDVHHLHAWSLTSGRDVLSAHVCVDDYRRGEQIRIEADRILRERFGLYFTTLQIEERCVDPESEGAGLDAPIGRP